MASLLKTLTDKVSALSGGSGGGSGGGSDDGKAAPEDKKQAQTQGESGQAQQTQACSAQLCVPCRSHLPTRQLRRGPRHLLPERLDAVDAARQARGGRTQRPTSITAACVRT